MRRLFEALAIAAVTCVVACTEETPDVQGAGAGERPAERGAAGDAASRAAAGGACTAPKTGRFMANLTPKKSCPWWTPKADGDILMLAKDSVRFPLVDDGPCAKVEWNGCAVKSQGCGVMVNASGVGYPGTSGLDVQFTDDEHVAGTLTFDIGQSCKVTFDLTAKSF